MNNIAIVDFQSLLRGDAGANCLPDNVAVQQLHSALTTIGFAFIVNHGIDENLVSQTSACATIVVVVITIIFSSSSISIILMRLSLAPGQIWQTR